MKKQKKNHDKGESDRSKREIKRGKKCLVLGKGNKACQKCPRKRNTGGNHRQGGDQVLKNGLADKKLRGVLRLAGRGIVPEKA